MIPKTFERWCEDNGRRWIGCRDYDEFARNAADYETYRARAILQAKISAHSRKLAQADGGDNGTS